MDVNEKDLAEMETHMVVAASEYFDARPLLDDTVEHRVFEAGFRRGWGLCAENLRTEVVNEQTPVPEKPIEEIIEKLQKLREEGNQMIVAVYYCK